MVQMSLARGIRARLILSSRLPYRANAFAAIVGAFVTYFIKPQDTFLEAHRILVPEGKLVVNIYKPYGKWRTAYEQLLGNIGFTQVRFYRTLVATSRISRLVDVVEATK